MDPSPPSPVRIVNRYELDIIFTTKKAKLVGVCTMLYTVAMSLKRSKIYHFFLYT